MSSLRVAEILVSHSQNSHYLALSGTGLRDLCAFHLHDNPRSEGHDPYFMTSSDRLLTRPKTLNLVCKMGTVFLTSQGSDKDGNVLVCDELHWRVRIL